MTSTTRTSGATSEYPSTHFTDTVEVPSDSWLAHVLTVSNLKNVTLWGISLLCAAIAWLGGCLFVYVLLSRYFLPATAHFSRSLYFDYTKADAVATAHFLPDAQYHKASISERFDVWLELATPEAHAYGGDEIFQVVGELLSADGRVAGSSSRPCLVRQRYWLSRTIRLWCNAPFVMLGMWDERRDVRVPLFNNYREQATMPFAVFRATLQLTSARCKARVYYLWLHITNNTVYVQARAGGGRLPQLYEAKVHLELRLGLISRLLSLTRPGHWIAWSLIGLSLFCIVGGSLGCTSLLTLWFLTRGSGDSSTLRQPVGNFGFAEDGTDTNEETPELSEDESASAQDIQGAVDDITETSSRYKDTKAHKLDGSASHSSFRSDDSSPSGFGAQEPHFASPGQQRGRKKVV